MERLTKRRKDGRWALKNDDGAIPSEQINKILIAIDRLAAYEDTGLEPEEVTELVSPKTVEIARLLEKMCTEGSAQHMLELFQAEKDGRLVVLPCKPDASAYQWKKGDDIPSLFRFDGVTINEDWEVTYQTYWGQTFKLDDFGKTVFLTRAEAEAALKKRESDEERGHGIFQ